MGASFSRSVGVALESTFASVSASTGFVDASGASFAYMECDRATDLGTVGDAALAPRDEVRADTYTLPPHPQSVYDSGNSRWRPRRGPGTVVITCSPRTLGSASAFANYDASPLGRILSSGMARLGVVHASASDAVASAASATAHTGTDGTKFTRGGLWGVSVAGRAEYSAVSNIATNAITSALALSTTLDNTYTAYLLETWYPKIGNTSASFSGGVASLGPSLAIQISGDGWRTYATGCRLESWRLFLEGDKGKQIVKLALTLKYAFAYDAHSGATASNPTRANGNVLMPRGAYVAISSANVSTYSSPAAAGRTALSVDDYEITYTNTLGMPGRTDDEVGMSDWYIANHAFSVKTTLSTPVTALDTLAWAQGERSLMIGFGGGGVLGQGGCVYMPAAHLKNDGSQRNIGGDLVYQDLEWDAGLWTLDDTGTAPADTHFRLGLGA